MTDTIAILVGGSIGITIAAPAIFFTARALARRTLLPPASPLCDRCDEPTGRPYPWAQPHRPWFCTGCQDWIDSQLFQAADDPGYDRDQHMAFVSAWREAQASWLPAVSGEQPGPRAET